MNKEKAWEVFKGLFIVALMLLVVWFVGGKLFDLFLNLWSQAGAEYKLGFIVGVLSVLGIIYTQNATKRREINARHFEAKAKAYRVFFETLMKLLLHEKTEEKEIKEKDLLKLMVGLKTEILIWGGKKTIKAWKKVESIGEKTDGDMVETFKVMGALLKALRKDLGHSDFGMSDLEFVQFFLNEEGLNDLDHLEKGKKPKS